MANCTIVISQMNHNVGGLNWEDKDASSSAEFVYWAWYCQRGSDFQWNPDFSNLQGKLILVRKIREFEKSGIKFQCSTEEEKQLFLQIIRRFKKRGFKKLNNPTPSYLNTLSSLVHVTNLLHKLLKSSSVVPGERPLM